jgi:hypothetical protein
VGYLKALGPSESSDVITDSSRAADPGAFCIKKSPNFILQCARTVITVDVSPRPHTVHRTLPYESSKERYSWILVSSGSILQADTCGLDPGLIDYHGTKTCSKCQKFISV